MKPIIFNTEMVRAILEGRKTQTRRIVKVQPDGVTKNGEPYIFNGNNHPVVSFRGIDEIKCPYGKAGHQLWVRETWREDAIQYEHAKTQISYKADSQLLINGKPLNFKWKPSIHMPKWASRITLEITDIRVERVQEITEDDSKAEGIIDGGCGNCGNSSFPNPCGCSNPEPLYQDAFIYLWNSINEKRGYGWDKNPWVWVVSFKRDN